MLTRYYPNPYRDYARYSLSYLLGLFFRRNAEAAAQPDRIRRILIVNIGHIGDAILSFGVVRNLRDAFPRAEITAVIGQWSESTIRAGGAIDNVIVYNGGSFAKRHRSDAPKSDLFGLFRSFRRPKFDIVVSMNADFFTLLYGAFCGARYRVDFGACRAARRVTRRFPRGAAMPLPADGHIYSEFMCLIRLLGVPAPQALPVIPADPRADALPVVRCVTRGAAGGPLVIIHPFGAYAEKEWPPERYARLIERLVEMQWARVVVTGAPGDETRASELAQICATPFENLAGMTSLPALAAVIRKSDLVITSDGGPMHLAAAVGVPIIALFGPTDPERWGPLSRHAEVFYRATDCGPCDRAPTCIRKPRCIDRTSVDEVAAKATSMLAGR